MKKLLSLVRAAVDRYDMIDDGDKIAVGVSGGKDSLALYMLSRGFARFILSTLRLLQLRSTTASAAWTATIRKYKSCATALT